MRLIVRLVISMIAAFSAAACDRAGTSTDEIAPLTIYAAASTTDLVTAVAEQFEARSGARVRCSFAASSTLARQIEQGARADVYISANPLWMDHLERAGTVDASTRFDWLANRLVLITRAGGAFTPIMSTDFALADALEGPLAIGDPDHVPAGIYARQALLALGWWDDLADRIIPAVDVRATLRLVELGEASAGIVYASDAIISERIVDVATFPGWTHEPIRYPVAICRDARDDAAEFIAFLRSPQCDRLIAAHQFRRAESNE